MKELLDTLAKTKQMSYFRCGFIQRMIDYQWNGTLVNYYKLVASCYLNSFILIAFSSVLLNEEISFEMLTENEEFEGMSYS